MSDTEKVEAAVDDLYHAFAGYPFRKHVKGCPCCVTEVDWKGLESAPLRSLSSDNLSLYAFKAMTTWGGVEDFKHFLPRVLELLISKPGFDIEIESVLGKLALAEWGNWPECEQSVIRVFFRAEWNKLIQEPQTLIEPDSWLCGMARAGENLRLYLEDWISARSVNAYDQLTQFVESNQAAYIKKHSLSNSFWPAIPAGVKQVCDWLTSVDTRKQLEEIYFENESAVYAVQLSKALQSLEQIAAA